MYFDDEVAGTCVCMKFESVWNSRYLEVNPKIAHGGLKNILKKTIIFDLSSQKCLNIHDSVMVFFKNDLNNSI